MSGRGRSLVVWACSVTEQTVNQESTQTDPQPQLTQVSAAYASRMLVIYTVSHTQATVQLVQETLIDDERIWVCSTTASQLKK